MKKVSTLSGLATGALLLASACATASPPQDLIAARASYDRARHGSASKLNPADLHTAEKAMQAAERSFSEDGDTQETRDLAYTADRRAQIAEVRAQATQSSLNQERTVNDMHAATETQMKSTSAQLGAANQQLALQGQALDEQNKALDKEREARAAADKRAAQAAADLARIASVKQEARGMVITLSGGVLFASNKAELLPGAQTKLNSVAESLTQQEPDARMVVEGHTDSQGSSSHNQGLSERRAQAVRDYLISRGIASDRVSAQGYGSTRSVADNKSPEGRANNRRVEIVVEPPQGTPGSSAQR